MTPQDVQKRLDLLREMAGDDETAHSEEDKLHRDVLEAIATGTAVDGSQMARLALTSGDIAFSRWCA